MIGFAGKAGVVSRETFSSWLVGVRTEGARTREGEKRKNEDRRSSSFFSSPEMAPPGKAAAAVHKN